MAQRANWNGYLKLSLVSCPIAMYPATSSAERVSFRQINKRTGNRLKQQLVDSETGDVVDSADKGRGYEIGKNQLLPVEEEEIEQIRIESTHTIDIEKFVPRDQVDERYLDSPYYIAPTDKVGQEAFAVIREAMRNKSMVGLGRVVIARRERLVMLEPLHTGLMATTLRYAYEVRSEAGYFEDIPSIDLPEEMTKLAEHILESKAGNFDPSEFEDRYETAVVEMLKRKQAGLPQQTEPEYVRPKNVINLMDALKRSIAQEVGETGESPKGRKGKRAAAPTPEETRRQPSFRLPIAAGTKKADKQLPSPEPDAVSQARVGRKQRSYR
jgi:DNA end-binding protein Ku